MPAQYQELWEKAKQHGATSVIQLLTKSDDKGRFEVGVQVL